MPSRKADAPADPDKLLRQEAGAYRTADGRFEVRQAAGEWFLVDLEQTNEFGQELMRGPFPSLKAARTDIPAARETKFGTRRPRAVSSKPIKERKPEPPPPPKSWIDELPRADAARVRLLIRALEGEGIEDAESVVRRDREGLFPLVSIRLIERRLDEVVEALPAKDRKQGRKIARQIAAVLSAEGRALPDPLPGWSLVEIGREPEPPNRKIDLRE